MNLSLQILKKLELDILGNNWLPNNKFLYIRELSQSEKISINTASNILKELAKKGLLIKNSTNGYYINVKMFDLL